MSSFHPCVKVPRNERRGILANSFLSLCSESWQPSWGVRTVLIALTAFFASEPKGAIGSLDAPPAERRRLAAASREFTCSTCGFCAAAWLASSAALPSTTTPHSTATQATPSPPSILPTQIIFTPSTPTATEAGGSVIPTANATQGRAPELPRLPLVERRLPTVHPVFVAGGGGQPLWTDRAILVILLALVALVVQKIR